MNPSTSEYSSGCESGWTTYLDQYSNSDTYYSRSFYTNYEEKCINDDDGEDLSMVSDASSAPRNLTYYSYVPEEKRKSKSKSKSTRIEPKEQNLCLDDTASSSVFHFSQVNFSFTPVKLSSFIIFDNLHIFK